MMRWFVIVLMLGIILLVIPTGQAKSLEDSGYSQELSWDDARVRARIDPALLKQMLASRPDQRLRVIVTMREQVPTSTPAGTGERQIAAARAALVESLRITAVRSQHDVLAFLADEQSAGNVEAVRSFWIFNGLALRAAPQTIHALALRDDVELIRSDNFRLRISDFVVSAQSSDYGSQISNPKNSQSAIRNSQSAIEWGVERVRADQVWAAFNITGTGVVVANTDTGVDYHHPALNASYRGNLGKGLYQHTANWFDAIGTGATYPYDGHGHGTHTMGTIVGQDGIGVAPGARWIAVRVLDSRGRGYDSWIHAGFEWVLAPGGDPNMAPDVLSNSWGSASGGSTEFETDLARMRQAGIFAVFSAGNEGPESKTVRSPAALPGAFAVGAIDSDNELAFFSGRGPSLWGQIKPQIVAPGVNVRSSTSGGAYASHDGTSMAAPHVAGVAALILAADPSLTITKTGYILTSTAVPLGNPVPNNNTGWGLVDAYAAVQAAASLGSLSGRVINAASRLPLPGATVSVNRYDSGETIEMQTNTSGRYFTTLAAGQYSVTASLFGYTPDVAPVVKIITGQTSLRDLMPSPLSIGMLYGILTDTFTGQPATATISVLDTPLSQVAYGEYLFKLPAGVYTLQAREMGYRVVTATVAVTTGRVTQYDFGLVPTPRILLVNSGAWYYREYPAYFRQALDELNYAYDERRIKHPLSDSPTITDLLRYDTVIWSSPEDAPGYIGAGAALEAFLSSGGKLLLTGQDVAFWDGGGANISLAPYLYQYLKTGYVRDDAKTRAISGLPNELMDSLSFAIAGGDGADNQSWPDEIAVLDADHAAQILAYAGDGSAGQKVGLCLPYRAVMLPFGYEAISEAASRREVMQRALEYFVSPRQTEGLSVVAVSPQTQVGVPGTVLTFTTRVRNTGEAGGSVSYTIALQSTSWTAVVSPTQLVLSPCASSLVTMQVNIPLGLTSEARNAITLTVQPINSLTPAQKLAFIAKTPAPLMLVDDDRWYNVELAYTKALDQGGISYDVWRVPWSGSNLNGPSLERLNWYPIVVWFTGYDWYKPLTGYDEEQLATYLDSGGRLMLSSVFYLDTRGYTTFARKHLGVRGHTYGMTATHTYGSPGHPLGTGFESVKLVNPFLRAGFFTLDYALVPSAGAETAQRGDHHRAQAIAQNQPDNRLVFWGIPFEALPESTRARVLQRTVGWLGPLGDSSVEVDPPVVSLGQSANVTLTVRNNLTDTIAGFTVALPSSLVPTLSTLPPGVFYNPHSNVLTWSGAISVNDTRLFTFQVRPISSSGTGLLAASVIFHDKTLGFDFDQPLALRVEVPDLQTSTLRAPQTRPLATSTVIMKVTNNGPGIAPAAIVTGVAPLRAKVISGSTTVDGPGVAQTWPGGATWEGSLESGQSVTVTYQIVAPFTRKGLKLPVEMLAWDGLGSAWEWRAWMEVWQAYVYLPLVMK